LYPGGIGPLAVLAIKMVGLAHAFQRGPRTDLPMSKTAAVKASALPVTYEAALQELEQLVAALDAGQLPLDQLLAQYQRGAELLRFCRSRLDAVEQQIRVFENGESQPWNAQ
jgi:exodeoxyribonuclease VII small subunit